MVLQAGQSVTTVSQSPMYALKSISVLPEQPGQLLKIKNDSFSSVDQPLNQTVNQLGVHTYLNERGMVQVNEALVNKLLRQGPKILPAMADFFRRKTGDPETYLMPILEGLTVLDRMAEQYPDQVAQIYPVLAPLNTAKHPLIQIYLAGVYREMKQPHLFGPLMRMLIHDSLADHPGRPPQLDPSEEVGGAMLEIFRRWGH